MTYLDTHVVVWLYDGNLKKLSREAARIIDRADQIYVSPAVEIELQYLFRRGRIRVGPRDIVGDLRARIGLSVCELPFPLVSREALAIAWTEDLFDRLIVAQASSTASPLLTADSKILENYPHAVW